MLLRPMSRALLAGATLLTLSAAPGPARGDIFLETGYVPTSSVVVPTSSIYSTSYYVPTSYTSSVIESTYIPTYTSYSYRRRRLFERSYYASPSYAVAPTSYLVPTTTILPTSYVSSPILPTGYVSSILPTTYVSSPIYPTTYVSSSYIRPTSFLVDSSLVATSADICCDATPSAPVRTAATRPTPPSGGSSEAGAIVSQPTTGRAADRPPSAIMNGDADRGNSSAVEPPVVVPAPPAPAVGTGAAQPKETATPPGATPYPAGKPDDPVNMPRPGEAGGNAKPEGTQTRESLRPVYATSVRNVLRGRVISQDNQRPQEGVTVIIASRTGSFVDRTTLSDADGEFKVSLPEGDWMVKVKMPSGSVFTLGRDFDVTASGGRVTDTAGRTVKEFVINR